MEIPRLMLVLSAILCHTKARTPTERTRSRVDELSGPDDAKFLWNSRKKPYNAVVVVANASAHDVSERSSKKFGLDSLSPDKGRTETLSKQQYHVTEPDVEDTQTRRAALSDGFSADSSSPSTKLPSLLAKQILTLTTTLLQKQTYYSTIYPSCLLLQNVRSVCDGTLKTVMPTTIKAAADVGHMKRTAAVEGVDKIDNGKRFIEPSSTVTIEATSTVASIAAHSVLSGEWGLEDGHKFENVMDKAEATPTLSAEDRSIRIEADEGSKMVPFFEPEIRFVTEYLSLATTEMRLGSGHTATVVAQNCVPADLHLPLCSGYPLPGQPIGPFAAHPLLPYSQPPAPPQPQEAQIAVEDAMRSAVHRLREQMRHLVDEDVRRITDQSGLAPLIVYRQ